MERRRRAGAKARAAKAGGASRFCMGAAWREPKDRDLDKVCAMVEGVKALGLETCVTLGMLTGGAVARLKSAGLDYYNHNLDTSPEFYGEIITTRTYRRAARYARACARRRHCRVLRRHRRHGRGAGGSRRHDRGARHACRSIRESVPINMLVRVARHAAAGRSAALDPFDFVRTIAVARITMPASVVRLSAGREDMSEETQALCFLAGASASDSLRARNCSATPNPARDPRHGAAG